MSSQPIGRTYRLPPSRRTAVDLLRFSSKVPAHSQKRLCQIPRTFTARRDCDVRISWPILFFKAYARVAAEYPELRRVFVSRPWARIYEHPVSVGRMTVAREFDGDEWVLLTKVDDPANAPLEELQQDLVDLATGSPEEVPLVKRQTSLANIPGFLRRLAWMTMYWSGPWRTRWLGTFGLTTVSKFGATALCPPVLGGTMLSFGPVSSDGQVEVVLAYDHRVIDGAVTARALEALEVQLETAIVYELEELAGQPTTLSVTRRLA